MKITSAKHLPFNFSESPQNNNLRWRVLHKWEDGSFEDQTGTFKCRDYFNDIVAKYNEVDVTCYGLDTAKLKLNPEGVYVELHCLEFVDNLLAHIGLISDEAGRTEQLPPLEVSDIDKTTCLMFIPRVYFSSTYRISFLTYLIRVSHTPSKIEKYDALTAAGYNTVILRDCPFGGYTSKIIAQGFKEPVPDQWVYINKEVTFGKAFTTGRASVNIAQSIHNAGARNVINMLQLGM